MRFMFLVKSDTPMPPTPALMAAMHTMADREIKAGRMLDDGGLMPLAMGAHVSVAGGKISVTDGPFVEAKEVVGGYAVFELPGMEEALASARAFMQVHVGRPGRGVSSLTDSRELSFPPRSWCISSRPPPKKAR